jgi:hypothetical protein
MRSLKLFTITYTYRFSFSDDEARSLRISVLGLFFITYRSSIFVYKISSVTYMRLLYVWYCFIDSKILDASSNAKKQSNFLKYSLATHYLGKIDMIFIIELQFQ